MASKRWIRVDVNWDESEWIADLEPAAQLAWVKLLAYVKTNGIRGHVRAPKERIFARLTAIPIDSVRAMLEAAREDGALSDEGEDWVVTNWSKYQEPDKTAAVRQRRRRAQEPGNASLAPKKSRRDTGKSRRDMPESRRKNALSRPGHGVTRHATPTPTPTPTPTETDASTPDRDAVVEEPSEIEQPSNRTVAVATEREVPDFESFWAQYPKRAGSNPKQNALRAWNARVRQGIRPAELVNGLHRYVRFLEASGDIATRYVLQAATFVGPHRRWAESWDPPPQKRRSGRSRRQLDDHEYTPSTEIEWQK